MIYVTHDQTEAMTLADQIVVLDRGNISQVGSPLELYNRPSNRFVASFVGSPSMNFLSARIVGAEQGHAAIQMAGGAKARIPVRGAVPSPASVELGVRPEHLALTAPDDASAVFKGTIGIVEHLGSATLIYVDTPSGSLIVAGEGNLDVNSGATVGLALDAKHAHLFGADGAAL
jgi:ABC-type sugar transport system ATPase subunit